MQKTNYKKKIARIYFGQILEIVKYGIPLDDQQ